MTTDDQLGGGFAEVRDGETITPVLRPATAPRPEVPDGPTA